VSCEDEVNDGEFVGPDTVLPPGAKTVIFGGTDGHPVEGSSKYALWIKNTGTNPITEINLFKGPRTVGFMSQDTVATTGLVPLAAGKSEWIIISDEPLGRIRINATSLVGSKAQVILRGAR